MHRYFLLGLFMATLSAAARAADPAPNSDLRKLAADGEAGKMLPAPATNAPSVRSSSPATNPPLAQAIGRLMDEGTNRSQIGEIFGHLTDIIGPRLTGSPNCKRALRMERESWLSGD